jgi:flagellar FliJ protein
MAEGTAHAMKSNDTLLKLRRFEANEKRQKVADIEMMIGDFRRMADDLARQIEAEEESSGIRDPKHFAYPTYAKAAGQRRANLMASIADLEAKLEEAKAQLGEALEELKKSELVGERSSIDHSARVSHAISGAASPLKLEGPVTRV